MQKEEGVGSRGKRRKKRVKKKKAAGWRSVKASRSGLNEAAKAEIKVEWLCKKERREAGDTVHPGWQNQWWGEQCHAGNWLEKSTARKTWGRKRWTGGRRRKRGIEGGRRRRRKIGKTGEEKKEGKESGERRRGGGERRWVCARRREEKKESGVGRRRKRRRSKASGESGAEKPKCFKTSSPTWAKKGSRQPTISLAYYDDSVQLWSLTSKRPNQGPSVGPDPLPKCLFNFFF